MEGTGGRGREGEGGKREGRKERGREEGGREGGREGKREGERGREEQWGRKKELVSKV